MKFYDLQNAFHNTSYRVKTTRSHAGYPFIPKSQAKIIQRKLCPVKDCTCGQDALNQRSTGYRSELAIMAEERHDGSVLLSNDHNYLLTEAE